MRTRKSSREVHRRETAARYGLQAALQSSSYWHAIGYLRLAGVAALAVALAGANLYSGFLSRLWLILVPLFGLIVVILAFRVKSVLDLQKLEQRIAEAMAGNLDLARRVPVRSADYSEFCAELKVAAYPNGQPDWAPLER